jgi:glutamine phosphoribosylpyrophosphate amidotransferase
MSIEAMIEGVRGEVAPDVSRSGLCHACFSGDYPIPVAQRDTSEKQLRLVGV